MVRVSAGLGSCSGLLFGSAGFHRRHERDVFFEAMVVIARNITVVTEHLMAIVGRRSASAAEGVPDAPSAPILIPSALNLIRRRAEPPDEILWKRAATRILHRICAGVWSRDRAAGGEGDDELHSEPKTS